MHPINTAILSFGMSGKVFHAPFIQVLEEYNFYGVWERSKNLAESIYPGVKTFRSIEELLQDEKVELVIVNTPNYTHFEYTKKALLGGKHVVVEKPFTVTVEEGEELIALAKKNNKVLSVFQNRRYDSDFKTVRAIIEKGLLGEIIEAEFHFDRYKPGLSPKLHKENSGPGTGSLFDLGAHLIDQALFLFGMPQAVFADIRSVRPLSQVDDYFEVLLYYSSLRVRLHCSYLILEALPAYILHGTKGSFIKSKSDIQELELQAGKIPGGSHWGIEPVTQNGKLYTIDNEEIVFQSITPEGGNYGDYFKSLYASIRSNKPIPVSAEEGLNVIKIILAAFKSSEAGKVISLQ